MANKTPKIQLFHSLREFFKVIGMHPLQLNESSFNLRNVVVLLFLILSSISSGAFYIYKADNIQDYAASCYTFITESVSVICFLSFRNNVKRMFEFMDELEAFIEKSELEMYRILIYFQNE